MSWSQQTVSSYGTLSYIAKHQYMDISLRSGMSAAEWSSHVNYGGRAQQFRCNYDMKNSKHGDL